MQHRFISINMEQTAYFTLTMRKHFNFFMIASLNYLNGQDITAKHLMGTLYIATNCLIYDPLIGKGYKHISYAAYTMNANLEFE